MSALDAGFFFAEHPNAPMHLGALAVPQPLVQTVTTNVPGPQFPLYILGRKMLQAHPYVPIGDNVKLSIAALSYLGQLSFDITAESSAARDLDVLAKGIRHGLAELHPKPATTIGTSAPGR